MKRFTSRKSKEVARKVVAASCVILLLESGVGYPTLLFASTPRASKSAPPRRASQPAESIKVNHTVPEVEPPKPALEFSKNPTPQEFFQAHLFEEPLVPIGGEAKPAENAALAAALLGYSKRTSPDDYSCLTGFLEKYPNSAWRAALLTNLGLQYYQTAHFSLALEAWSQAWLMAKDAKDLKGTAIADRAAGELAYMLARLGRMEELTALFQSVEGRVFRGPATEKISGARQGLSNMQERPEIAFRCGPLALLRIKLSIDPKNIADATKIIDASASTQKGFSLASSR